MIPYEPIHCNSSNNRKKTDDDDDNDDNNNNNNWGNQITTSNNTTVESTTDSAHNTNCDGNNNNNGNDNVDIKCATPPAPTMTSSRCCTIETATTISTTTKQPPSTTPPPTTNESTVFITKESLLYFQEIRNIWLHSKSNRLSIKQQQQQSLLPFGILVPETNQKRKQHRNMTMNHPTEQQQRVIINDNDSIPVLLASADADADAVDIVVQHDNANDVVVGFEDGSTVFDDAVENDTIVDVQLKQQQMTTTTTTGATRAVSSSSSSTTTTEVGASNSNPYRERLIQFYQQYNPSKLTTVDSTLQKYYNREEELFYKLQSKYNNCGTHNNHHNEMILNASIHPHRPIVFLEFEFSSSDQNHMTATTKAAISTTTISKTVRLEIQLYQDIVYYTCENFRCLCTGEKQQQQQHDPIAATTTNSNLLCYRNSIIHRIVPNMCIQGGDITVGDGTGGKSIYPPNNNTTQQDLPKTDLWGNFIDESFVLQHTDIGLLSMANNGPNRNNSQFFITLRDYNLHHLDNKHVVFGKVIVGMDLLLKEIATIPVHPQTQRPLLHDIRIVDCGEIRRNDDNDDENDYDDDDDDDDEHDGDDYHDDDYENNDDYGDDDIADRSDDDNDNHENDPKPILTRVGCDHPNSQNSIKEHSCSYNDKPSSSSFTNATPNCSLVVRNTKESQENDERTLNSHEWNQSNPEFSVSASTKPIMNLITTTPTATLDKSIYQRTIDDDDDDDSNSSTDPTATLKESNSDTNESNISTTLENTHDNDDDRLPIAPGIVDRYIKPMIDEKPSLSCNQLKEMMDRMFATSFASKQDQSITIPSSTIQQPDGLDVRINDCIISSTVNDSYQISLNDESDNYKREEDQEITANPIRLFPPLITENGFDSIVQQVNEPSVNVHDNDPKVSVCNVIQSNYKNKLSLPSFMNEIQKTPDFHLRNRTPKNSLKKRTAFSTNSNVNTSTFTMTTSSSSVSVSPCNSCSTTSTGTEESHTTTLDVNTKSAVAILDTSRVCNDDNEKSLSLSLYDQKVEYLHRMIDDAIEKLRATRTKMECHVLQLKQLQSNYKANDVMSTSSKISDDEKNINDKIIINIEP